jgi:hypothetical protein
MKYSAKALICAVLLCGNLNQKNVSAVEFAYCKYCRGTEISPVQLRQEACGKKTLCFQCHRPHNPCEKIVWKTQVKCLNDRCSKINDHFECDEDSNLHTFRQCPRNS